MLRNILFFGLCVWTQGLIANNVQISNITWDGAQGITFDISWDNSWRSAGANPAFYDAVWVFVKVAPNGGPNWNHATMNVTDADTLDVITPSDTLGAIVRRASQGTGSVSSTLSFTLGGTMGLFPDIKVFAIEMVYVPSGPFYAGDGASNYRFHVGNDTAQAFLISTSDLIPYGTGANQIFTSSNILNGDIPADFPNGYDAFYCMKYEISQLQYAEFLNCLTLPQQESRTETTISNGPFTNTFVMTNSSTLLNRNTVRSIHPNNGDPLYFFCDLDQDSIPNEFNDGQNLAMNYLSYDDLKAYLDWAALRAMTVLEYEKACRGPSTFVPGELAWGTAGFTAPGDIVLPGEAAESFSNLGATGLVGHATTKLARCGFAATDTSTRLTAASTYYGVMEMSGNVLEYVSVIGGGDESNLGDGYLDAFGFSDDLSSYFTSKGFYGGTPLSVSLNASTFGTIGSARSLYGGGRGVR
jgi:formylglycine-generating enzyme required for sulfatase activity